MPEDDWISKFRINGNLIVHILIKSLMLWKNLWLQTRTGSFEENTNICLVERTTYRVHCVLIFKCSHPVSQMSTNSMWECTCSFGTQAITRQAILFSLYWHKRFCLHLFISLLRLSHLDSWISLDTALATAAAGPPPLPSCFHTLG